MIVECIKLYGYDIYLLPRHAVRTDDMFGEDVLSQFPDALQIEAYIENVEGFGGMGETFSKFGIEINDMVTFLIATKRFDEVKKGPSLLYEDGYPIVIETGNNLGPGAQPQLKQEGTGYNNDYSSQPRPNEGDLVYFPLVGKLFEIRFVEHEKFFYPLGRRMIYQLKCEEFQSSSEAIDTGIAEIDAIETATSTNIIDTRLLAEDGSAILSEDGSYIILETKRVEDVEPLANNELFQGSVVGIVDFSEKNPFVSGQRY